MRVLRGPRQLSDRSGGRRRPGRLAALSIIRSEIEVVDEVCRFVWA